MISINDYRKQFTKNRIDILIFTHMNITFMDLSNGGMFIPKLISKHTLKLYYCIMNALYKLEFHLRSHDDWS